MDNRQIIDRMKSLAETMSQHRHDAANRTMGKEKLEDAAKDTGKDIIKLAKTLGLTNLSATIKEIKPILTAVSKKDAAETIAFLEAKNRRMDEHFKRANAITNPVSDDASAKDSAISRVNSEKTWFIEYAQNGGKTDHRLIKIAEALGISWLNLAIRT